jgi:uncharacterized protein (TIRG00374 family)
MLPSLVASNPGRRWGRWAALASRSLGWVRRVVGAALVTGVALLLLLFRANVYEVWARLNGVSSSGLAIILAAYLAGFRAETASWLQTIATIPAQPRTLDRLYKVLMVGNAVERVTPFGGEPAKVLLLNRYESIPYGAASASLVITRMTDVMALIFFVAAGLVLMWRTVVLPPAYRAGVLVGFGLFVIAGGLFFLVQNQRVFTRVRAWLGGPGAGARPRRLASILDGLHDVEDQLVAFYSREPRRLFLSVAFTLVQWSADAIAIWLSVWILGSSLRNVFAVQAFVLMVVGMLFFVPGDLGTQDAALAYACGTVTGSLSLGVAVAALRRARDILWLVWGFAIGAYYAWHRP